MSDKESDKENINQGNGLIISPGPAEARSSLPEPMVFITYRFAPEWFADARNEMDRGRDPQRHHSARRREIIFAVCCAESYLTEWVLHEVLNKDIHRLNELDSLKMKKGIFYKWKEVPKELHRKGMIPATPNFNQPYWKEWEKLLNFRDGLIHARSSLPEIASGQFEAKAYPSKTDLDNLRPGWATHVVVELIENLHKAVGTSPPSWLNT